MNRKAIFITGAASGIGRAAALLFAEKGWFVGLFDLNESALDLLAGEIGPEKCCRGRLDVTNPEEFKRGVQLFTENSGGVMDILFNCAGVLLCGKFGELPLEKLLRIVRTNVDGTIIGTHVSLPTLRKTPNARVINMSSASSFYGVPEMAVYSASKAAIRSLTEALNLELEECGIAVSDIAPSFVNTPMVASQRYEAGSVKSLGVHLTPERVAEFVWRATVGKNVHWVPEWRIRLTHPMTRWSPGLQRAAMNWIAG
jgi:NAD(P)-dependent dehydrogenase (short-subunit alcohol dehydrogenase family)